jgi:hypothetical protein
MKAVPLPDSFFFDMIGTIIESHIALFSVILNLNSAHVCS